MYNQMHMQKPYSNRSNICIMQTNKYTDLNFDFEIF